MKKEIEGVVDITQKEVVLRSAVATGILKLSQKSVEAISSNQVKKR